MDWKKETLSSSELEKMQKEYLNRAIDMMNRRGGASAQQTRKAAPKKPAPVLSDDDGPTRADKASVIRTEASLSASVISSDTTGAETPRAVSSEQPASPGSDKTPAETAAQVPEKSHIFPAEDADDDKYGVYTADEVINTELKGEGLKKAAEILEEMTRSTEMMKKLAESGNEDDASDTTDFPDFSCDLGEDEASDSFRRTEEACEEAEIRAEECGTENERQHSE